MATANSVLFDSTYLRVLKNQYTISPASVYPRGSIFDRKGIKFNNRSAQVNGAEGLYLNEYNSDVAKTVIGQTIISEVSTGPNALRGVSGIQYRYDSLLNGGSPYKINACTDANNNILSDYGYTVENDHANEGGSIYLTLDYNLQKAFEEVCNEESALNHREGIAVILTQIPSKEILCMVSCTGEMNKTVLSYQPGSVMKILTLAIALERETVEMDDIYECKGYVIVDGIKRYCDHKSVHGKITIKEAFAYSCNCCFYNLAKKLCYTNEEGLSKCYVTDYAQELGFSAYPDKPQERFMLEYEDHFNFVPAFIENDTALFNTAIGQGNVQASVYMINKITAAIADTTVLRKPYLVGKLTDAAGNIISEENNDSFDLKLSEETIFALRDAMASVASFGTASNNTLGDFGSMAGKTGTSENELGFDANSWFTGYFPLENPKYCMTVLIECGGSSQNALKLFDRLANVVYEIYPEF